MKALKGLIVVAVVVALAVWVFYIFHLRSFKTKLVAVHAIYEEDSREKVKEARKAYEGLRDSALFGKEKRMIETGVTCCDAVDAWYDLKNRFHLEKHKKTMALMKKAKTLTGDQNGVWAKRIEEAEEHCKLAQAPSLDQLRNDFEAMRKQPVAKALAKGEVLHRNRNRWRNLGMYLDDKEREAFFRKLAAYLKDNYAREFEKAVATARALEGPWKNNDKEFLRTKSALLKWVKKMWCFDRARAGALEKKYPKEIAEAKKAQKRLEVLEMPPT